MAIHGLLRVGEVCLRVLDIDDARRHYGDRIGLIETYEGDADKLYYKGSDEHDWYSLVLKKSDVSGVEYFAFKTSSDADIDHFDKALTDYGLTVEQIWAGGYHKRGRRNQFQLTSGLIMQNNAQKAQERQD